MLTDDSYNFRLQDLQEKITQLEKLKNIAETANQMKSEFIANISHDLSNPITAILGFSQILKESYNELTISQKLEYNEIILESARHALALIHEILDLAKIQSGKKKMDLISFSIFDQIQIIIKMNQLSAQKRKISIKLTTENESDKIITDKDKFMEILNNLLNNAIKYSPEGDVVGIIVSQKNNIYKFCIWDHGIGIQEDDFYALFQPFSQLPNRPKSNEKGTGLGLYHSKQLVEFLDGIIYVESGVHQGSRFIFELPKEITPTYIMKHEKGGACFFGLEMAGKTSIINFFENNLIKTYKPTFALIITRVQDSRKNIELIDCPGQMKLRNIWEEGLKYAKCLVFVLDISDRDRFLVASQEFKRILNNPDTNGMNVLVLYHKIDLKIPVENFREADLLFNIPIPSHKLYFVKTSIKIDDTMKNLKKLISEFL